MHYYIASYDEYMDYLSEGTPAKVLYLGIFLFCCLFLIVILQAFLHEGGHLLFGLLSGYRFVSFRIFYWVISKYHGKYHFSVQRIPETFGQCIMKPSIQLWQRPCYFLLIMGGIIVDFVCLIIAVIFILSPIELSFSTRTGYLIMALYSLGSILLNGIPRRKGFINNDGTNLCYLRKDKRTVIACYFQMEAYAWLLEGKSYKDMPEFMFKLSSEEEMTNGLIAWSKILEGYYYMDLKQWDKAMECIEELEKLYCMQNSLKCCKALIQTIRSEKLFLLLKRKEDASLIEAFYSELYEYIKKGVSDINLLRVWMTYQQFKDASEASISTISKLTHKFIKCNPCKGEAAFFERMTGEGIA